MPLLMDAVTMDTCRHVSERRARMVVTRLSVTVMVTRLLVILFLKVMMMMGVFLSLSSPSLFTSPSTLTTEACSAH